MRRLVVYAVILTGAGCGKSTSRSESAADSGVGAAGSAGGVAGGAGGSGGVSATGGAGNGGGASTGGAGPVCTYPESRDCSGRCVDLRTDPEHCGSCGSICSNGEDCRFARCAAPPTCEPVTTRYEAEAMEADGGSADDTGWSLGPGERVSTSHAFVTGRAVLELRARGLPDEPRPFVTVTVGAELFGPLRIRSAEYATYSLELESPGQELDVVVEVPVRTGGGRVSIDFLVVRDCAARNGFCDGGGFYLTESDACAPPTCDEPTDCHRDFVGPDYVGACAAGRCEYPRCDEPTASGALLYEELAMSGYSIGFSCFALHELVFPLNSPRTSSIEGAPDDFECPAVDELTWEVERFSGEGSCQNVPLCGPNRPSEVGLGSDAERCCYMIARTCGA